MSKKIMSKEEAAFERRYMNDLHKAVDQIFEKAADEYDWSWKEFAENANVSYITVTKLGNRETRYPRHCTIYKLAEAVGMELTLSKRQVKLRRKVA